MTRVHLVACGNVLCGDDGAGPCLLHKLRELQANGEVASSVRFTDVGLGLSSWRRILDPDEVVIFLDAAAGPWSPGTVSFEEFHPELLDTDGRVEHGLHPLRQFALEQALYPADLPKEAWLCLIYASAGDLGPARTPGTGLSSEVEKGIEKAAVLVSERLRSWSG